MMNDELEHKIIFTLIDMADAIRELEKEEVITTEEFKELNITLENLREKCGFVKP